MPDYFHTENPNAPQLSPTTEAANDEPEQIEVTSKPFDSPVQGETFKGELNPQPTPLAIACDPSDNRPGQNQQNPTNRGKESKKAMRSLKKVLFICLGLALLLAFFLELQSAKYGSAVVLAPLLTGTIGAMWTLVKSALGKGRSAASDENCDIGTSILCGVKQIWRNIRKRNTAFALFVFFATITFSALLAQVHAVGWIGEWVSESFTKIAPRLSRDSTTSMDSEEEPGTSSEEIPQTEQTVPNQISPMPVDPPEQQESFDGEIIPTNNPTPSLVSPTLDDLSESRESLVEEDGSSDLLVQNPAPSDGVQTKYLSIMEPDRFRTLTETERSELYFFSGEYSVENWWDDTEVLDVVRRDAESLIQKMKPNMFDDAPEEVKEKASQASENERTLTNSWELDEILSSREAIYVNYPMYSLAVLIAENNARFGLAYNDCRGNSDTIEYYFGQAIHWYREAMMYGPSTKEAEHLLRFIGHRYHDLAACLSYGSETQHRSSSLADAYYSIADSLIATEY